MVTPVNSQVSGACGKVTTIFSRYGPCSSPESGKIHYGTSFLYCLGTLFVKQCFGGGASGSNNHRLKIRERVKWMVCHSDRVSSSSEATTCNHEFSESE